MGEFSAEWLALREPFDHAARSEALAAWVFNVLPDRQPVRILDLGCGTGSNWRYLERSSERPYRPFFWQLVDEDDELLARVPADDSITTVRRDLRTLDPALFTGQHLVTASALLDLVSADWISGLARECRAAGAAVLFALSYDGRIECDPSEPDDHLVRDLVNRHQHLDKGFGPAVGPEATRFAESCFMAKGYEVRTAASDWVLEPDLKVRPTYGVSVLQRELIAGWARAAAEIAPQEAVTISEWRRRRLAHVDAGRSRILVGHQDLAAVPVSK